MIQYENRKTNSIFATRFPGCGAVGSASGLGPEGRQFESGHPDLKKSESESGSDQFHSFSHSPSHTLTSNKIEMSKANDRLFFLDDLQFQCVIQQSRKTIWTPQQKKPYKT